MNMNQIKYFVSVFELGSFSRASQQCSVTVQAISKSINDLEKELELSLFTRASNGVVPTIYGKGFYEKARLTLASFQTLEAFAHNKTVLEKEAPFCIALCAPEFNYYQEFCASIATFIAKNISFNVKIGGFFEAIFIHKGVKIFGEGGFLFFARPMPFNVFL